MSTLNITTSRPRLDVTTTNARLDITNRIRRFSAKRVSPQMKVERRAPQMKVDWNRVWAQSGRRSPEHLRSFMRQASRGKVDRAIQRTVQNGNYMLRLEDYIGTETSPVAELAQENMVSEMPEVNVASMPQTTPSVQWDPGYVRIEWTTGEVQIEWDDDYMPDIKVTPHSVEIRLEGRSGVKIAVDEQKIAHPGGKRVNKQV